MKKSKTIIIYLLTVALIAGIAALICIKVINSSEKQSANELFSENTNSTKDSDDMFTERDLSGSYDKNSAVKINLNNNSSDCNDDSVIISGSKLTVTKENVYYITGSMTDGQIVIDADDAKVQLVLDSVNIENKETAAIYVKKAKKVFVTLADGTQSTLSVSNEFADAENNKIDSTVYSKDDLVINGTGKLNIVSDYGHAIAGNDDLKITNGTLNLISAKKAIKANDSVRIANAEIDIDAGKQGIHCDEDVYIRSGKININQCSEGIEGKTITIDGGTLNINSEDDGLNATSSKSSNTDNNTTTADNKKPFEYDENAQIYINGGNITINANGDGIDSNGDLTVCGGNILIYGAENDGNGALDFGGKGIINGGTVAALGMSGMAVGFDSSSSQCSMLVNFSDKFSAGIVLTDSSNNVIMSIDNSNSYNSAVLSSPDINKGEVYTLKTGNEEEKIEMTENVYSNASDFKKSPGNGKDRPMKDNPPDGEKPSAPTDNPPEKQ